MIIEDIPENDFSNSIQKNTNINHNSTNKKNKNTNINNNLTNKKIIIQIKI